MKNQTTRRILAILLALVLTLGLLPTSAFAARIVDDEVQTTAPVEDAGNGQATLAWSRSVSIKQTYGSIRRKDAGSVNIETDYSGNYVMKSPTTYASTPSGYTFSHFLVSCGGNGGVGPAGNQLRKGVGDTWAYISGTCEIEIVYTGGSSSGGSGSGSGSGNNSSGLGTGHHIDVKVYKVVLDSSRPLGYQTPSLVTTLSITCNDGTTHSGYNHFTPIKQFHPTKVGLSTTNWVGYQFASSYSGGRGSATFYDWSSGDVDASANVTGSGNFPCSKNFYLIYDLPSSRYTITYSANGGSGAPGNTYTESNTNSTKYATLSNTEPTRSNYKFLGWSTDPGATSATYAKNTRYGFGSDTDLYAVWQKVESKTITVKKVFAGLTAEQVDAFVDDFAIVYNLHQGSQTGSIIANSALMLLDEGADFDEDTMTAKWTISYENPTSATLYLELSEFGGDVANYTYTPTSSTGSSFTEEAGVYTTFITVGGGSTSLTRTITNTYTPVSGKVTLTYDAGIPSSSFTGTVPAAKTVDKGTKVTVEAGSNLDRNTHNFRGWSTTKGSQTVDYAPGATITLNADTTLYAVWGQYQSGIRYHSNDGQNKSGGGSDKSLKSNTHSYTVAAITDGSFTSWGPGKTFKGWNTQADGTGTTYAAGATASVTSTSFDSNNPTILNLYAMWESDAPYVDDTTPTCTATVNKAWAGDLPENMRPQNVSFDYEVTYTANDVQQAYTESGTVAPGGTITMHKWSFPSSYTDEQKHPYRIHVKLTEKNAAVAGYNHVFGAQYPADASGFSGNTCTKSFAGDHLSGTICVKNTYTKITNTANYTVQWYDTLGNVLKKPETRPGTVDETVNVTGADKTVEKYDFVAADSRNVTSATLAESGTVLKLYFQPKKPTNEFLYNLGSFTLQCQDKTSHQTSQRLVARDSNGFYNVWSSGYAAYDDAVTKGEDSYTWSMTVHADQWLALYQNWHEDPVHTLTDDQAEDIILTFTWNEGTWELPDGAMPFTIKMEGHKTTYTWKDEGDAGHVWKTATVSDCLTAPTYDGTPPTKAADDDYTYTFDRWDGPATTDDSKTYTAVYTPTAIPKLEITKTALVTGSVKPGDEVRYQIMVTNVGNTDVTGVVITDALDSNLEFEGAVGTGKIWDAAPVEGKYDFGERVLGSVNTDTSTITLTITATVADGVANGTTIPNVATVDCPNMPEDNKPSDDVNITVGPTNGTVTVKYVTDDETPVELGSVSYEAAIDADYDHSVDNDGTAIPENGSATAKSPKTITTEAGVTYAYDAIATNSALTGTVSDGLVITVVYAADTKGNPGTDDAGEPTDEPDGTPDKYQVKVTFHVVNGFWNDGANADVVEYLEKYTDGVMAADGVATLGDIIPGAGERPISNEYRAGNWDVTPAETTMISADTTYTYTYVAKGHYTVIWLDDDGSVLHPQETVLEGDAIPSKPIPNKAPDNDYTYTFSGWDDDVDETTGDVTRTATYTATARPKATVTWVDHDGTVLEGPVTFNTDGDPEPAQTIDDPTEYEDDDNVYTFVNWTRAVDETTGNITYTATYDATPKYTVTWKDGDTTILEGEDKVKGVDDVPEFPGELPEAPEGKEFDRWGDPVVDDETHTITVPIVWKDKDALTVKWVDEDGTTELTTPKTFFKGEAEPSYDGQTPTKASDATYNYSFKEWVKTTDDQGNITYTASYDATRKSTGGGGGGGSRPVDPPEEDLGDEDVPLAELPMLNQTDHFAYIIGKPDGNVHPLGNITRAEVVTIFFRIMTEEARSENWGEINEFSDVTEGMWYNHAVCTAVNAGLIKGMPDGTFGGDRNITRAEFATIAARFLDTATQPAETFTDIEGHWAEADINRATVAGWIKGVGDGKFNPDAYITRAEVMTLVNRMLNRKFDETNTLADMVVWADNMDKDIWYYGDVQEATNDHEYERKAGTLTETWTKITEPRDWSELEK